MQITLTYKGVSYNLPQTFEALEALNNFGIDTIRLTNEAAKTGEVVLSQVHALRAIAVGLQLAGVKESVKDICQHYFNQPASLYFLHACQYIGTFLARVNAGDPDSPKSETPTATA